MRTFCRESRTFEDIFGLRSRIFVAILEQELRIDNLRLRIEDWGWGLMRIQGWGWWLRKYWGWGLGLRIKDQGLRTFQEPKNVRENVKNHALLRIFQKPQNLRVGTFWYFSSSAGLMWASGARDRYCQGPFIYILCDTFWGRGTTFFFNFENVFQNNFKIFKMENNKPTRKFQRLDKILQGLRVAQAAVTERWP